MGGGRGAGGLDERFGADALRQTAHRRQKQQRGERGGGAAEGSILERSCGDEDGSINELGFPLSEEYITVYFSHYLKAVQNVSIVSHTI